MMGRKQRKQQVSHKTDEKRRNVPVQVGDCVTFTIDSMGNAGEGVGRLEGFTIFVPYALPGEDVTARITLVKKNYAVGELQDVCTPSPARVKAPCPVYGHCGGCQLQHASYEEQLRLKTEKVRHIIARIAKDDADKVCPTKGQSNPWYYRNKMQLPVGGTAGNAFLGFYERGSHDVVPMDTCLIQDEGNNALASLCHDLMKETGVEPYDETTGTGTLRHVIGRIGHDEWMLIFVTTTGTLPQEERWVEALTQAFPKLVSMVINTNDKKTNVIMGRHCRVLYGTEQMRDNIKDLQFSLSPHSFFQVNPEQTVTLYEQALTYAGLTGGETVIDAYCGTGTISLFLAKKASHVIGIEIVEPAIVDAKENAKRNGIDNTRFIAGDAAVVMPALYEEGIRPDVIVFDPVRAGCHEHVLQAAAAMEAKKLVYVSCNPASMARDIEKLRELGYELQEVTPVDMFPHTAHVEAVSLLIRSEATR